MRTIKPTSLLLLLILSGGMACSMFVPPMDENANATGVANTLDAIVQLTQEMRGGESFDLTDSPTAGPVLLLPTSTWTPIPSSTSTPIASATWIVLPTSTSTPGIPMMSVTVPTNCREGPGKVYDMVGAILVGEWAPIYARDAGGNYWYIRNPDNPNGLCWAWGEYAIITGVTYALPVFTPPPTPIPSATPTATRTAAPSPAFDLSYAGLESCSGWWVHMSMHNTGNVTFESVNLTVTDTATSTVLSLIADDFTDYSGCDSAVEKAKVAPGKAVKQSSPKFAYDPSGHNLKATATLCSNQGVSGICTTRTITFTP